MGFFIKLLLKAGVTLGALFVGYKFILPSIMGGGFNLPDMGPSAPEGIKEVSTLSVKKDVTVYQWVDENGVTHYGGSAPIGQGGYEKKTIHANTNLMQARKAREKEEEKTQRARVAKVGSVYSPEGIKDMIDSSKEIRDQASERNAEQQKILDQIMGKTQK